MKEELYTIELTGALKSGDECFFCYIEWNLRQLTIGFTLDPSYMESGIRDKTDRQGFCKAHTKNMFDYGNSLGNAWILKSRLGYLRRGSKTQMDDYTPGKAAPAWRRKKSSGETPGPGSWIQEEGSHCYIYGRIQETYGRVLDAFIHALRHKKGFMDMVGQFEGFCIHHFADLRDVCERSLNQKEKERLFPVSFAQMEREFTRIQGGIGRLIEKYDYRNVDADWKTSKDAVQQTMQKIVSDHPADPVFKSRRQELDKTIWILAVVCGLLSLIYMRSEYEKKHFSMDTYEVCSKKIHEGERTFVSLSNLHGNRFGAGQKDFLETTARVKPDRAIPGGGMMVTDGSRSYVDTERALYLVRQPAGRYPVYYGFGSHGGRMDWSKRQFGNVYREYREKLHQAGVYTVKGWERYEVEGNIVITGVELPKECYWKFSPERLDARLLPIRMGEAEKEQCQILLVHTPIMLKQYQIWGADLALSSHFHGGIIRLPLLGGLITPQFQFFCHYCDGQSEKNGHTLIASQGLGIHSVNIHLNNQSQLVVAKLKGEMDQQEAFTETAIS